MTNVFIGGSRAISNLNDVIREQLDNLMSKRCMVLIGDANGADKAVQKHFAEKRYQNVIVFCMEHCRNNVGGWHWDGESRGALNNVLNLLGYGKKVLVYLVPHKNFYKLSNEYDLDALLARCDQTRFTISSADWNRNYGSISGEP